MQIKAVFIILSAVILPQNNLANIEPTIPETNKIITSQQQINPITSLLDDINYENRFSSQETQNKSKSVAASKTKSLVDYVFDTRGADWSTEAAEIIVQCKSQFESESSNKYLDFAYRTDLRWQIDCLIAKIADEISLTNTSADKDSSQDISQNIATLSKLIGEDRTYKIINWLTIDLMAPESAIYDKTKPPDISNTLDLHSQILASAINQDPLLKKAKTELDPYLSKTKKQQLATKIAYSSLGIAAFVPNLLAPIAETTLISTMMSNGGPEQDKLLKELYLAKQIALREAMLDRETNLALHCYSLGLASKNSALLKYSQALSEYISGHSIKALNPSDRRYDDASTR